MNNWHYKDKMIMNYHDLQIESNLMEPRAIVYCITHQKTNEYFIGSVDLITNKYFKKYKKKNVDILNFQTDWMNHYGSSAFRDYVDIENKRLFDREILHICDDKKVAAYLLMQQQFKRNVLYDNKSWNNNIGGRYNFIPAVCNQLRYERFMEQY